MKESPFCLSCRTEIAFIDNSTSFDSEIIDRKFWGRIDFKYCESYMYYTQKSIVREMIHNLKYGNKPHIGKLLGAFIAERMSSEISNNIDLIIPIPSHYKKVMKRGYNQAELIAHGIGSVINKPVSTDIINKYVHTSSQTDKGREDRYRNVMNSYKVLKPSSIRGKHILIVDDVITTGATIEACASVINDSVDGDITMSMITAAMARS